MEQKISPYEFFTVIFMVPYGTAILYFLAPEAKQDAWIVMLIYVIPALLLHQIYLILHKNYPQDTIVTWMPKIFGKAIGKLISGIYVLYFAYLATRVLRDFVSLIEISAMYGTSPWIITCALGVTIIYGVYTGVENLCRITSTFFVIMMSIIVILIILFFRTSNVIMPENLRPILPEGIAKPVISSWNILTFPYGETIIATMLYVKVSEPQKIKKAAFAAIILEGIILSILHICFIVGLGVDLSTRELFPLLDSLRLIRVTGFLDRLDLFIIVVIVFNGFIKTGFFLYASVAGTAQLLGMKNQKSLVAPIGIAVCIGSIFVANNYPQHLRIGLDFTVKYIHLPIQIVIPILSVCLHYLRNGFKNKAKEEKNNQCPKSSP